MLQMNKAEAKRYEEKNITIMSMIISSSHSYIYYIFLKFYTIAQQQQQQQTDRKRETAINVSKYMRSLIDDW